MPDRAFFERIAQDNLMMFQAGCYTAPDGRIVDIAPYLRAALARCKIWSAPSDRPGTQPKGDIDITLTDHTTIDAVHQLSLDGYKQPAILNFASARSPGGGFLRGAMAQEESLCRAMTLYPALAAQTEFYAQNRAWPDTIYADAAIYTPHILCIRDGFGHLKPDPIEVAVITCPAPNKRALRHDNADAVGRALRLRARLILDIAAYYAHDALVLGAWGCGVFGNDPRQVAQVFAAAITQGCAPGLRRVHFAIPKGRKGVEFAAFSDQFT
jgi:uncharacterized protein (TIGR02452 family)